MTIVTFVKSIVDTLVYKTTPSIVYPSFYHGEEGFENIWADNAVYPAVFLGEPIKSDDFGPFYNQSDYPLSLFFANKTEFNWDMDKHQVVVDDMRNLARKFLLRLEKAEEIRELKEAKRLNIPLSRKHDACLSGCVLTLKIKYIENLSACLP